MKKDPMKYTLLGGGEVPTDEKLAAWRGRVGWSDLRPHFKNGVLFYVDPDLALEAVGAAFAEDRQQDVQAWLRAGDLVKIEALHAAQWEVEPAEFEALVVSPFVLCQLMAGNGDDSPPRSPREER